MSLFAMLRGFWSRLAAVGSIGGELSRRSLLDRVKLALWAAAKYRSRRSVRMAWHLVPIAGGAPDDPEDDPDPEPEDDPEDDPEPDPDPEDDPDDDDPDEDPEPEPEPLTKKERDRLNQLEREAAERRKNDKAAAKKRAEKEGKHAELIRDTEKERDDERERADTAEAALATFKRNISVSKVARRLRFADPDDAPLFLPESLPEDASETDIEKALREVAKAKPYLLKKGKSKGRSSSDPGSDDDPSSGDDIGDLDEPKAIREAAAALRK